MSISSSYLGKNAKLKVLYITLEFENWGSAAHWGYTAGLGFEEGFEANHIEYYTLTTHHNYGKKKPSWLSCGPDFYRGWKFDQVWAEIIHTDLSDNILDWLANIAPIRIGFIDESLELTPQEWKNNPAACQIREESIAKRLNYFTHYIAVDETDVTRLNREKRPTLWYTGGMIPGHYIYNPPPPPTIDKALFYGALYGEREKWLGYGELPDLIEHPVASKEYYTAYPKFFDELQQLANQTLVNGSSSKSDLQSYLDTLRKIRRACFVMWLEGLQVGSAVINLPQFGRAYAGRVIEGMAAGRPVISWEIPDRPMTKALFEDGKEILLYSQNNPDQLVEHIKHVIADPDFNRSISENARRKLELFHTTEMFVKQVIEWASGYDFLHPVSQNIPRTVEITPNLPILPYLKPGDLVFDIGANVGSKSDWFLQRGARVVCIEPQPDCVRALQEKYRGNSNVVVVAKGLADKPGELQLSVCSTANTISTFSEQWKHGRFSEYQWDKNIVVDVTTMDNLIDIFGVPKYCKIDVEGFEFEVLQGLSKKIPYISLEFANEFYDKAKRCVDRLIQLGFTKFNVAIMEDPVLQFSEWVTADVLFDHLMHNDQNLLWGDIYAMSEPQIEISHQIKMQFNKPTVEGLVMPEMLVSTGLYQRGDPLRLHLGCGEKHFDGYINIDYPPSQHDVMQVAADLFADIANIDFPLLSVDEIRLHHVFEHFGRVDALAQLIRWHRWLKVGGRLHIETPDLAGSAKIILSDFPYQLKTATARHLAGDQAASWAYHLDHWFPERFSKTFEKMGFDPVQIHQVSWDHEPYLANVHAVGIKARQMSDEELLSVAEELLRDSTVSEVEKPTLEIWKSQLRKALEKKNIRDDKKSLDNNIPLDIIDKKISPIDTRSISDIHDFNQLARDEWMKRKANTVPAGSMVIDIGAGTCPYRSLFSHCVYKTQDFKKYTGIKLGDTTDYGEIDYESDITSIPVPDNTFDVVLCTEVLEHVLEPIEALREMTRILKPGGRIFITAPLGSGLHQVPYHFYGGYTPYWYRHFADQFHLSVLEITPNGGFFKMLAQECARVAWTFSQHQNLHGTDGEKVYHLFNEWLPRYLFNLDEKCFIDQFTVGYFVEFEKINHKNISLVFSKDRAMQLDATLKSFVDHCSDASKSNIFVLYRTSSEDFAEQYSLLINEYTRYPFIKFVEEINFNYQIVKLIESYEYVLFLVDDNLFVKNFSLEEISTELEKNKNALGFSLRLGKNTTYCYMLNSNQELPEFLHLSNNIMKYAWTGAKYDFGYPLEISSSAYRVSDLLPLITRFSFENPNSLESMLDQHKNLFIDTKHELLCFDQSVTFCAPMNKVQKAAWLNRVADKPEYSSENLAMLFAQGMRINIDSFSGFVSNSCHQEVEFKWLKVQPLPLVSIVIPCYKQANYLPEAVESVVNQTFSNWECIIVNDGSPDNTSEVAHDLIARYPDKRIRLIEKANGGLADARNYGISQSLGKYILPLDSDDKIEPLMLEKTVALLEANPGVDIAYTGAIFFGAGGVRYMQAGEFKAEILAAANPLYYCSLYRRKIWEEVGGYNRNMVWGYEDWDFWVDCVSKGFKGMRIPEPLFLYRVKEDSMYTKAVQHDAELKAQIVLNHPELYAVETKRWAASVQADLKAGKDIKPATTLKLNIEVQKIETPADFDEDQYLSAYADVAEAVRRGQFSSGWEHYDRYGRSENRIARFLGPVVPVRPPTLTLVAKDLERVVESPSTTISEALKITHINTQDIAGGAAKVAWRLSEAQRGMGYDSRLLVGNKSSPSPYSSNFPIEADGNLSAYYRSEGLLYYEFQGSHRLVEHPWIRQADILHLHNLHGDYFNPFSLLLLSQIKPIIWTLHDMQALTGHCAHSFECEHWKIGCGNCPDLTIYPGILKDATAQLWKDKKLIYDHSDFEIVVPSAWLKSKVERSILKNHPVEVIYNGVDTRKFSPRDKTALRRKYNLPDNIFLIGCVAQSGLANPWKGGKYILEIMQNIIPKFDNCYFLNIGAEGKSGIDRVIDVPYIQDEADLADLYSMMDVFLYTTVADNCPLVILEAMACGVPIVTFATGGIPELLRDDMDGYVVGYKDSRSALSAVESLYKQPSKRTAFSSQTRQRSVTTFAHELVASQYEEVYFKYMEFWRKSFDHPSSSRFSTISISSVIKTKTFNQMIEQTETMKKQELESWMNQAKKTLEVLLDAEDLPTATKQHEHRLTPALLSLVKREIKTAQEEGESELVEGLENLANYIEDVLTRHNQPKDEQRSGEESEKTLRQALALNISKIKTQNLLAGIEQKKQTQSHPPIIQRQTSIGSIQSHKFLVSAIVSTYNSEKFIRGCLEDLEAQTMADRLEIIVIDSGSQQNERAIVTEFQKKYSNIVYLGTEERETVYAAWNRGIQMAHGKYITNANTDDAHYPDALEKLAAALDAFPEADLAYSHSDWTPVPFDYSQAYRHLIYPPYQPVFSMFYCLLGPHPVWRRTVFDKIGLFDAEYRSAGDYEYQLRFTEAGLKAVLVPEVLSLFCRNPQGISLRTDTGGREQQTIWKKYRDSMSITRLYHVDANDPTAVAQAWVALGNFATGCDIPWSDNEMSDVDYAINCYGEALSKAAYYPAVHNIVAVWGQIGKWKQCEDLLRQMHSPDLDDLQTAVRNRIILDLVQVQVSPAVEPLVYFSPESTLPKTQARKTQLSSIPNPIPVRKLPVALVANQPLRTNSARTLPFNKVCNVEDFSDPELAQIIREVFPHELKKFSADFPRGVEYRKYWEIAMSVRALRHFGALHRGASILGVGAGTETTTFYLTLHAGQVVATDLYRNPGAWGKYAPGFMFTEPEKVAPYPFERERLVVQHMDGRILEFPDNTFEGIFSSGSIEHFGGLMDIAHSAYEMGRVLKLGGVLTLSTEYQIRGPSGGIGWEGVILFTPEMIQRYIVEASGLEPVDALDLIVSEKTLASQRPLHECTAEADAQTDKHGKYPRVGEVIWSKYPHLVLEYQGYVFGSVHLTLRKTENYPICVNNWARPVRGTATITQLPPIPAPPINRAESLMPVTTKKYPITIAIDARTLFNEDSLSRGIGHYSLYHLSHIISQRPQWLFILYGELWNLTEAGQRLMTYPNVELRPYEAYKPDDVDLIHILDPMTLSPGFDSGMRLFHQQPLKTITFFDLIPLRLYEKSWDDATRQAYHQRLEQTVADKNVILTISEYTRQDLIHATQISPEHVKTIMAGLNRQVIKPPKILDKKRKQILKKHKITKPFFMYVGSFNPHKNIPQVIDEFMHCHEIHPCQMVFVGRITHEVKPYMDYIAERKLEDILFTGYIPRQELEVLYQEAVSLVFLSRYEGFGFPVLEAMANGCPVICSNVSSIPEVAGDAALIFSLNDVQGIAKAMVDLIEHPEKRRQFKERGLKQAAKFKWEEVAAKTIAIWEEMLESKTISKGTEVTMATQEPEPEKPPEAIRGPEKPRLIPSKSKIGFNVIGYVSGNLGLGVLARDVVQLLLDLGIPVAINDLDPGFGRGRHDTRFDKYLAESNNPLPYPVNLFILPPPDFTQLLSSNLSLIRNKDKFNAILTMWELSVLPSDWVRAFEQMDVLVAETNFIRHTFESHLSNVHIVSAIHPLYLPEDIKPDRKKFGLPQEGVLFVTSFEPFSDPQRKNPTAVFDAFERALGQDERAHLVVKLNNAGKGKELHPVVAALRDRCNAHPRMHLITETMDYRDVLSLYASCDVYISLHRAEGLGLGPMESMSLGKPVIATAWSGNTTFMNYTNSCLVGYRLIPVEGSIPAYSRDNLGEMAIWADADIDEAVSWMHRLVDDPELRVRIGQKAKEDMEQYQQEARRGRFIDEIIAIWEHKFPLEEAGKKKATQIEQGYVAIQTAAVKDSQVDIVIPIYGQPALVQRCVDSVLATTTTTHVILVDDCSPGFAIKQLYDRWLKHPRVTMVKSNANGGFIGSCTLGASLSDAPFILFLNSDTEAITPGWLEKLIPSRDDIAIVGAKLLHPPSTPGPMAGKIQHAGVARDDNGVPYHPFLGWDADSPQVNQPREVNAITGACFLVRRQVWDELGDWDARFGRGVYEDVDLCWQARQKSYRVLYQPAACLYHHSGASEAVGGRHLLYGQNKTDNLEKLLTKWQGMKSDEDIFFGKETVQRWRRARKQINQAAELLEQHQFNQALSITQKAVKTAPDLPDVLIGYAQLLAAQGKHRQAAEQIVKALEFAPAHWDARLRLVDEWLAAGMREQAITELAQLKTVFPDQPAIQEREAAVAGTDRVTAPKKRPASIKSTPKKAVQPVRESLKPAPAGTLQILLEADDLPKALEVHQDKLDAALLELVRENANAARADGEVELAEGLDDLAAYIEGKLRRG